MDVLKIVVVDDDALNTEIIAGIYKKYFPNYKLYQTNKPLEALDLVEKVQPDLIITDWNMPIMSGIELLKALKKKPSLKDIPVIMATGVMLSNENLETALSEGAIDYIRKPIDEVELIARTKSALRFTHYYKMVINKKNHELTENSLLLAKTQQFKRDTIAEIESIKDRLCGKCSDIKTNLSNLITSIDTQLNEDNWYRFNLSFSQIHPNFQKNISQKHPNLTPADLKLCSFIRLGMANKEIAAALTQTPDSIKTARYRIRKKMALTSLNLETYLTTF